MADTPDSDSRISGYAARVMSRISIDMASGTAPVTVSRLPEFYLNQIPIPLDDIAAVCEEVARRLRNYPST